MPSRIRRPFDPEDRPPPQRQGPYDLNPERAPIPTSGGRGNPAGDLPAFLGFRGGAPPPIDPMRQFGIVPLGGGQPGEGAAQGPGGDGEMSEEDWIDAELRRLYEELSKPLDLNDPLVQNILQGARTTTLADLAGRGIHGGYSELNAQQAYTNAAAGLQEQKSARALQALQGASGRNLQKTQQQFEADKFGYENDPASGWGALIGGGLGALGGAAIGGPAGAGIGAQFGSQIGAGIGGMSVPRPKLRSAPPPRRTAGGY